MNEQKLQAALDALFDGPPARGYTPRRAVADRVADGLAAARAARQDREDRERRHLEISAGWHEYRLEHASRLISEAVERQLDRRIAEEAAK